MGLITGKPLSVQYAIEMPEALRESTTWTSAFYRASDGSTRTDTTLFTGSFAVILDACGRWIVIHPASNSAHVTRVSREGCLQGFAYDVPPEFTGEAREFFDVPCVRLVFTGEQNGEAWLSRDYNVVISDTAELPEGRVTWVAASVDHADPDPGLFEIPEGFEQFTLGFDLPGNLGTQPASEKPQRQPQGEDDEALE